MIEEDTPSFNAQLRALRKGQSLAQAERYAIGTPQAADITEALSRMRRTVNAAVSRIRKANVGSYFRVESGAMITSDNEAIVAVVSVSRL